MPNPNWREAVANAEHYLAIGQERVYIDGAEPPWELVTHVDVGTAFSDGRPASLQFTARHRSGLELVWARWAKDENMPFAFAVELESINLKAIISLLPPAAMPSMRVVAAAWIAALERELGLIQARGDKARAEIAVLKALMGVAGG